MVSSHEVGVGTQVGAEGLREDGSQESRENISRQQEAEAAFSKHPSLAM